MGDLSLESMSRILNAMLDVAMCPVCHDTVRQDFTQCVNSHPICVVCKDEMLNPSCPTCKQPFSERQPSVFDRQMVGVLPQRCQYLNCSAVMARGDDHETFCGYQSNKCKLCPWKGPGKEILEHVKHKHSNYFILKELTNTVWYKVYENPKGICPVFVFDQFLWMELDASPDRKLLSVTFVPVPNGKPEENIYAKIEFASLQPDDKTQSTSTVKLNFRPNCSNHTQVYVSGNMLSSFLNEYKELETKVTFVKENELLNQ